MNSVLSTLKSLHFDYVAFCCQLVLFLVLHFSLKEVLYRPMLAARGRRNADIDVQLAEAERLTAEARHSQTEYETQRQRQRAEIMESTRSAIAEASQNAEASREAARVRAAEILKAAQAQVAAQQIVLESEFEARVEKVAEAIARRVVETSVSPALQSKVISRWKEA